MRTIDARNSPNLPFAPFLQIFRSLAVTRDVNHCHTFCIFLNSNNIAQYKLQQAIRIRGCVCVFVCVQMSFLKLYVSAIYGEPIKPM